MEKKQTGMKKVSLAEILSALDAQIAVGAILISNNMDAHEIGRLHFSESDEDEMRINALKNNHEVLYFFGADDCPIEQKEVDLLIVERLYIVKLR